VINTIPTLTEVKEKIGVHYKTRLFPAFSIDGTDFLISTSIETTQARTSVLIEWNL